MDIAVQLVMLISLCNLSTVKPSNTSPANVTFVRLKSTFVKPYCPTIHTQRIELAKCARMCVDRNQLCSVIEYTGNNCTLWKYVLFAENA